MCGKKVWKTLDSKIFCNWQNHKWVYKSWQWELCQENWFQRQSAGKKNKRQLKSLPDFFPRNSKSSLNTILLDISFRIPTAKKIPIRVQEWDLQPWDKWWRGYCGRDGLWWGWFIRMCYHCNWPGSRESDIKVSGFCPALKQTPQPL